MNRLDRLENVVGLTTYAGSALVVMSLMFLVRDIQSRSFFIHAGAALSMPGIFLSLGVLIRRRTHAPLVADGMWTAGVWLLGVAILLLDAHRSLIPTGWLQTHYWLIASGIVAVVATAVSMRTRLVLIVPMVAILQGNFVWAALRVFATGSFSTWEAVLMTGLAAAWYFIPFRDVFWRRAYQISAALLLIFLCAFVLLVRLDSPPAIVMTWLIASGLFLAMGIRQNKALFLHIGAWTFAGAWALVYRYWIADPAVFGLWMTLPAGMAILFARLTRSSRKRHKPEGVFAAMSRWTAADLATGLSAISLVFTAAHLWQIPATTLSYTLLALVAVWLGLGIEYRLAILVHMGVYVAPIPLTFLLLSSNVAFVHLPALGIIWQLGGAALLLVGHGLQRQRFAIRIPFFLTGYVLVGVGNLLADSLTLPVSLGITMLVTLLTAEAVLIGWHPVWDAFVQWIAPQQTRPYAHRWLRSAFLLLGAWFAAVWFQLMLGMIGLPAARQGLGLVLVSSAWFLIGWMVERVPGAVGWYVHSAGWLLWGIGLLQVFYSPTEAIITAIFGLVVSTEEWLRQRRNYWMPVVIMQVAFITLQAALLLSLPPVALLAALGIGVITYSLFAGYKGQRQSRWIAIAGTTIILFALLRAPLPTLQTMMPLFIQIVLIVFAGFSLLIDRRRLWIGAVAAWWCGWLLFMPFIAVDGILWQLLPLSALLIALSRSDQPERDRIELVGIGVILAALGLLVRQIGREAIPVGAVVIGLLLMYSIIAGRRRSFVGGSAGAIAGALYLGIKLNPWLVPLVGGGMLITLSLLVETRREFAEQRLERLTAVWRSWH